MKTRLSRLEARVVIPDLPPFIVITTGPNGEKDTQRIYLKQPT